MKRERIIGTQASLFDELPNGQRMLFNMIPPEKNRRPSAPVQSSMLEQIGDEIDRFAEQRQPMTGQSRLF